MSKIISLKIQNFRGIKDFSETFKSNVICLIGRGDSRKTTILEAISAALSPRWNHSFYDTDFYELNTDEPLEITISLTDLPEELLTEGKYGLYVQSVNSDTGLITDEILDGGIPVLTIQLKVDSSLEPSWLIINGRNQESKLIKSNDRAKLNCFMISDYLDSHFSWDKGNPLYSLLKNEDSGEEQGKHVLEAIREAKIKIDNSDFKYLEKITAKVKRQAAGLGLGLDQAKTTVDFKDLRINEGKVSLHEGKIPFRLMGKGSKRIASIAIQTAVARNGGVALIDEIEQGLEPDRVRNIVRNLKDNDTGQVIITTHSRDVITELNANDLVLLVSNKVTGEIVSQHLGLSDDALQGVIRACPEAFFAEKVIVCEGSTEVGISRALDLYRSSILLEQLSLKGCAYIDGTGHSFTDRANKIKQAGISSVVFCDSDRDDDLSPSKIDLQNNEIQVFDCDDGNSIEKQVFNDLPWDAVLELINYVSDTHNLSPDALKASVESKYQNGALPDDWIDSIGDTAELRQALSEASTSGDKEWFKRIDHGEILGQIIFKYFDQIDDTKLKVTLQGIIDWVDN